MSFYKERSDKLRSFRIFSEFIKICSMQIRKETEV